MFGENERKLGFGLMRLPLCDISDESSVNLSETCRLVDRFLEKGFTYFDTAWNYHNFRSEEIAGQCLTGRHPRDSFLLASKMHKNFIEKKEDREKMFREQLRKTGAEYFDNYLLHSVEAQSYRKYERLDCFRYLEDRKREGYIRHIGFSFHDTPELLDRILTEHPEIEFVQLQINYLDWESPWIRSRKCYETAIKHGLPVIVMEPVKGGTLAQVPPEVLRLLKSINPDASAASWAVRFAASLPNVEMVLSGMSKMEQLEDNTSCMAEFHPLSETEKAVLQQAASIITQQTAVPCTGCSYCTPGCPMNIPIPKIFSLYNEDKREVQTKGWSATALSYRELVRDMGKPGECIGCGKRGKKRMHKWRITKVN
jgi:hypothetical protein